MNEPVLSVLLITYNHEKYISQALDSVLAQKTDFEYEIVVGEDCSTDNTRQILDEYKRRYPGIIRLLYRKRNFKRPTLNVYDTAMHCRGKYIATLEGDDFWTDEKKLQKAVDFLERHAEYSGCANPSLLVGEDGEELEDTSPLNMYKWDREDYILDDFLTADIWPGQTASIVTRNFWQDGKLDYTVLYRAHDVAKDKGENWNSLNMRRDQYMQETYFHVAQMWWLEQYHRLETRERSRAWYYFKLGTSVFIKRPSRKSWELFVTVLKNDLFHVLLHMPKPNLTENTGAWRIQSIPEMADGYDNTAD